MHCRSLRHGRECEREGAKIGTWAAARPGQPGYSGWKEKCDGWEQGTVQFCDEKAVGATHSKGVK